MYKKLFFFIILMLPTFVYSQFLDEFNQDNIQGWFFFTGDGNSTIDFVQKEGKAAILVDATNDKDNVWWAIIKRDVSGFLDLNKFKNPDYELRVEARVRASIAPRRVNFMINTQRTIDFHEHLKEFDIADTSEWHIISMTTKNLDVIPGDSLYVQLCVTDWGVDKYQLEIDYYRADIIDVNKAEPDKGEPLFYHPPIPQISTFSHSIPVSQDAVINSDYPDVNFSDWHINEHDVNIPVLTIANNQWAIMRWDFGQFKQSVADGEGLLELTTHSVLKGGDYITTYGQDFGMEFGKVRVIEILGGSPKWEQNKVTYKTLFSEDGSGEIVNGQMIFDAEVIESKGGKNFITISRPVLQRLLDGKTKGLMIKPLGAINASFYASEELTGKNSPKLYFNTKE